VNGACQRAACAAIVWILGARVPIGVSDGTPKLVALSSVVDQPARPRPLHALVVEDNRINQTVAVRRLEKCGCTVDVVENGQFAVRRVQEQRFDVVFMDCQMPVMDGYEATRQIRRRPEHAGLPIVAMTANAMEGDRERCLEAGMTDYLSKPLQPAALAAVLDGLRRMKDPQPQPSTVVPHGVFDEAAIRSLFDDDVEAMRNLIGLVTVDLPRYAARLASHLERAEWTEVGRLAHTIKGAASNVSGSVVVDAAHVVEQASTREDAAAVLAASRTMSAAIGTLVEALDAWGRRLALNGQADAV